MWNRRQRARNNRSLPPTHNTVKSFPLENKWPWIQQGSFFFWLGCGGSACLNLHELSWQCRTSVGSAFLSQSTPVIPEDSASRSVVRRRKGKRPLPALSKHVGAARALGVPHFFTVSPAIHITHATISIFRVRASIAASPGAAPSFKPYSLAESQQFGGLKGILGN